MQPTRSYWHACASEKVAIGSKFFASSSVQPPIQQRSKYSRSAAVGAAPRNATASRGSGTFVPPRFASSKAASFPSSQDE